MIRLKTLLTEMDDEQIIKYKDKDGNPGEMKAGSAKTMKTDHPAKIAWDKMQDSEGGEDGKSDAGKVSFDRTANDDAEKAEPKAGGDDKTIKVGEDLEVNVDKVFDAIKSKADMTISAEDFAKQIKNGEAKITDPYDDGDIRIEFNDPEGKGQKDKASGKRYEYLDTRKKELSSIVSKSADDDKKPKDAAKAEPKDPKNDKGQKVVDGKITIGEDDNTVEVDIENLANTLNIPGINAKTLAKKFESGDAGIDADSNGRIDFNFYDDKIGDISAQVEDDGHYDFDAQSSSLSDEQQEELEYSLEELLKYQYHDDIKSEIEDEDDDDDSIEGPDGDMFGDDDEDSMAADMNNNEDSAVEYEENIEDVFWNAEDEEGVYSTKDVDIAFDTFDKNGNPRYQVTINGKGKEITVDQKTGEVYDYDENYKQGWDPKSTAHGNVNESKNTSGMIKLKDLLK